MLPCRSCSAGEARHIGMIPALNGKPGRALIAPIVVARHADRLSGSPKWCLQTSGVRFHGPALLAGALGFLRAAQPKMISEQETSTLPFADKSLHSSKFGEPLAGTRR